MANTPQVSGSEAEEAMSVVTLADRKRVLTDLLRGVSRTFYLTLRILPKGLREPVGLAYLLARAADTIADTRLLPPQERLKHLVAFRAQVEGPATVPALREIGLALTDMQSIPEERELLTSLPKAFSMLEVVPEADRTQVRSVVVTLTQGMEMDLATFPAEDSGRVDALKDPAELDRYIYYVAGCVGEFWTAITMAHSAPLKGWDVQGMSEVGVGFGKALQLTNVLRDVPRDLRIGRCYLPETELTRAGVTPEELLDPSVGAKARPVLVAGIETALEHYRAAEEYLIAITPALPAAAAGGAVADFDRAGDAGQAGGQPRVARPGQAVQSQPGMGLPNAGPLLTLRSLQQTPPRLDSPSAPTGGGFPLRERIKAESLALKEPY